MSESERTVAVGKLAGVHIILTRAEAQSASSADAFAAEGARVHMLPVIETRPIEDGGRLRDAVRQMKSYDWTLFTSANAVRALAAANGGGLDRETVGTCRTACVGPETAAALQRAGIAADLVADRHVAEGLIEALREALGQPARVLFPRALHGRDVLVEALRHEGHTVDLVPAYETVFASDLASRWESLRTMLKGNAGSAVAILFTSPSTVEGFVNAVGPGGMHEVIVASIGPVTTDALTTRGIRVDVTAQSHTVSGMVAALAQFFASR